MSLKIMPVGGVGETGALNCMLYETDKSAVLMDCGVSFAGDRYPGGNIIIPKLEDLEVYREKLKAVVLTHGHEDHLGAIAFFRQHFALPVYATPFAMGIVRQKLEYAGLKTDKLHTIKAGQSFQVGDFHFEAIHLNHSMLDVVAYLISVENQKILHLTDFKIDHSSPDGKTMDLARLKQIGKEGLDLLLMDSTNVFAPGWTDSEATIRANLLEHFLKIKGRIVACLFSSNIYRIQSLLECARITGRKVAFTGRSTKEYTRLALEIGQLDTKGVELYDVEDVTKFADSEILVIATGSQGEGRSVLQRMSHEMFRPFRFREGDTLLMSSKMIPGNEGRVLEMINRIALMNVDIVSEGVFPKIHASGHAKQDELREVFRLTTPKHFIPIHGEYRYLKKHVEIAHEEGVAKENCRVMLNGEKVSFGSDGIQYDSEHEIRRVFLNEVDLEIDPLAIRKRRKITFNGLIIVSVLYDELRKMPLVGVEVDTSSVMGTDFEEGFRSALKSHLNEVLQNAGQIEKDKVHKLMKVESRRFYREKFHLIPEVMTLINDV